jgi:hypothetical protein
MRLLRIPERFDHPEFIFEPKFYGFRALAHIVAQALNLALPLDKASILLRLVQRADGRSR